MAKDHGLCNGYSPIDVAECQELLLLIVAKHIVLLDSVQCLLLPFQFDNIGVRHDPLCKFPHRVLEGGREQQHLTVLGICPPLDAYTLILVALCGNHDISLIQHKHLDLFGINELKLEAPVQHCARSANDNLTTLEPTFIASDGIFQFNFRIKFPHLFNDFSKTLKTNKKNKEINV
uniref:Uncharacterized protein n=1 Tax=Scleropages formosus TaxID=113540 RepID=A0A8C9S8C9_SCLFO